MSIPLSERNGLTQADWDILANSTNLFENPSDSSPDKASELNILESSLTVLEGILENDVKQTAEKVANDAVEPVRPSLCMRIMSNHINRCFVGFIYLALIALGMAIEIQDKRGCVLPCAQTLA